MDSDVQRLGRLRIEGVQNGAGGDWNVGALMEGDGAATAPARSFAHEGLPLVTPGQVLVSCTVDTDFEELEVRMGGRVILRLAGLKPYLRSDTIDLMRLLRWLPAGPEHETRTTLHVRSECKVGVVVTRRCRPWSGEQMMQWKVTQCQGGEWLTLRGEGSARTFTHRVPFNFVAHGLLFALDSSSPPLEAVTLHIRGAAYYIPAGELGDTGQVPFAVRDCYYLPLGERVNLSAVGVGDCWLTFHLLGEVAELRLSLWCLNSNLLRYGDGKSCIAFSSEP